MASSGQGPSKSVSFKFLEGLLQCSVCFEQFDSNTRSPRQLQCHHTFCLQCLISIAGNGEYGGRRRNFLNCPTCRQEHNFGLGGVQQMPTDHKIVQLMDALLVADDETDLCNQHRQQPLNFFCKTCEVAVCRDCTVVSHNQTKGHEVVEISEALKEFSPQFINTRDTANKISEKLQATSNKFDKAMQQLTENEASQEKLIRTAFAGYHAQLEEREKALLSQLRGYVSSNKDEFEKLRKVVDDEVSTFRKLDEQFEEAKKQQDIKQHFVLMHQMKKWETSSTDLVNDKDGRKWCEYSPHNENSFRNELFQLGKIDQKSDLPQQKVVSKPVSDTSESDKEATIRVPVEKHRLRRSREMTAEETPRQMWQSGRTRRQPPMAKFGRYALEMGRLYDSSD